MKTPPFTSTQEKTFNKLKKIIEESSSRDILMRLIAKLQSAKHQSNQVAKSEKPPVRETIVEKEKPEKSARNRLSSNEKFYQQRASKKNGGLSGCSVIGVTPVEEFPENCSHVRDPTMSSDRKRGNKKESARKSGKRGNKDNKKSCKSEMSKQNFLKKDLESYGRMMMLKLTLDAVKRAIDSIDARVSDGGIWAPELCTWNAWRHWLLHSNSKNKQSILRNIFKDGKFCPINGQVGASSNLQKSSQDTSKKGSKKKVVEESTSHERKILSNVLPVGMIPGKDGKEKRRWVKFDGVKYYEDDDDLWELIWQEYGVNQGRFYMCGNPECSKSGCNLMFRNRNSDNPFESHFRTRHLTFVAHYCLIKFPDYKRRLDKLNGWWASVDPQEKRMIQNEYCRIEAERKKEKDDDPEKTPEPEKKKLNPCNVGSSNREGKATRKSKGQRTAKQERSDAMTNEEWKALKMKEEHKAEIERHHVRGTKGKMAIKKARKAKALSHQSYFGD
jgi:hypothetical protein